MKVDPQKLTIATDEKGLVVVSEQRLDFFDGSLWHSFEPRWEGGGNYDPLFAVLKKTVESVETFKGTLTIRLQDEMILKMEPHPLYESWHLYVPEGGFDSSPSGATT